MNNKVLITGGAGFIGMHLVKALLKNGWEITVLDNLNQQVHSNKKWSGPSEVNFIYGDIRDKNIVAKSLKDIDFIIHLASETGVGQSSYEITQYVSTNELGTAILLEEASKLPKKPKGIILTSSRAVYGEGRYECPKCGIVYPQTRSSSNLSKGYWDPLCPSCKNIITPLPHIENQKPLPSSIYGVTKLNQEHLLNQFSQAFNIPSISLRLQNVYGAGQSLTNPYTGILAIFSTRIINKNPVLIYEDGNPLRDFIYVSDVVKAILLVLTQGFKDFKIYNVGSGKPFSILDTAKILLQYFNKKVPIKITGKYRLGDIRHSWAETNLIKEDFGFIPETSLNEGLKKFVHWVKTQPASEDRFKAMEKELEERSLLKSIKPHPS